MKLATVILICLTCAELFGAQDDIHIVKPRGRRDPFTFAFRPEIPQQPIEKRPEINIAGNVANADQQLDQAERALMERRVGECIERCEAARASLKDTPAGRSEIEGLRQSLLRTRKAGEAMRERDEATAAFGKLNLTVSGVIARQRKSQAIVNGLLVREGQTIPADANETLMIERITSEQVVVNFRGYRMVARLSASAD